MKKLSERIAERVTRGKEKEKSSKKALNRATFIALRGDVKQALDDGWPVKTIWETLHGEGKISFSYQAFRGYVNRIILSTPTTDVSASGDIDNCKKSDQATPSAEKKPEKPVATGFVFDNIPKAEELF